MEMGRRWREVGREGREREESEREEREIGGRRKGEERRRESFQRPWQVRRRGRGGIKEERIGRKRGDANEKERER